MKNSVIAIQSFVITTIVYAHLAPVFFEMDNVFGEENFVDDNNDKITPYSQQIDIMETECKSPCPSHAEMCIEMCA
jgi:hypothetical protein